MKAVIVSVSDEKDIIKITKLIKNALRDNNIEASVQRFEDKSHLALELRKEGNYEKARKEVLSRIMDSSPEDESVIELWADTAMLYLEREQEKIEEKNVEIAVNRAYSDIKNQIEVHRECKMIARRLRKAQNEKTLNQKKDHGDDKVPYLQQAVI